MTVDAFVLDLGGVDVILGVAWERAGRSRNTDGSRAE